ncbi:hypothetical protein HIM_01999 [Hirsutella minnesotensis 3608]|nr:hypothetical protein HIM_01999 [Hirsutella minnesotensis 3608]
MTAETIPRGQFDSIPDSIEAFRNGEFLVVLDDPGRENEADLIIAAEALTTEQMAWMVRYSSGYICVPVRAARADALGLPLMVSASRELVDDGQEVPGRAVRSGAGMLRGEASIAFARKWGLKVCTIADLVHYVEKKEGKLELNGSN